MIDTDKYEPTQMDWILHNTREHSPDGWRKLSKSLIELSDDDKLLIQYAPLLLAEIKRLKAKLFEAELWVMNDSYTFENSIKELNDHAEEMEE